MNGENIPLWFDIVAAALALIVWASIRFGRGIKPYDEGQPRTPGADYTGHTVCNVHDCHRPANGWHRTERMYMCDKCAIEFDALRKERHRRNSA